MNWLSILLVHVLNVRSEEDLLVIQKVFFLENDFWCGDQEQLKTDKGYLYSVDFDLEHKKNYEECFNCVFKKSYHLKSINLSYFALQDNLFFDNYITSFLESPKSDEFCLKFRFSFSDKPIFNLLNLGKDEEIKQEYVTYKFLEKISKTSIKLGCNRINIQKNINKGLKGFLKMKPLKFNEYAKFLNNIENCANFDLFYFENYSECLKSLKKFIKNLCHLKLVKDGYFNSITTMFTTVFSTMSSSDNKINTLKVSQFRELLYKKFDENLNDDEINENIMVLFDLYCDYIEKELQDNNILFPLVGDNFNINFYITQLSEIFNKSIENLQKEFYNLKNKTLILPRLIVLSDSELEKLQENVFKEVFESEYVHKDCLGKEVQTLDDYVDVQKMLCDNYNMLKYIFILYLKFKKHLNVPYHYASPILIDKFNLKIIDGIKIKFNYKNKLKLIVGIDKQGEEITMVEGTDYFFDENTLYCPSEVLDMKNIQEIEIISIGNEKNNKRFKISDYLI